MKAKNMIEECLDLIEENISEDLSLHMLADTFYTSKYHFHRIFLAKMGDSIMHYIRRRRIVRASHALMSSDKDITCIALDYGFNSLDVFTRAFKSIYGMPPSDFRRLKSSEKLKESQEGEMGMNFRIISEIIQCSVEDRIACISTLDMIIETSKKAHSKGLLALEEEVNLQQNKLFQKGIELLLYGIEPFELRNILENYITVGNYSGKELLERILIVEGILAIQQGDYPWVIREKLISYFGEDCLDNLKAHFDLTKSTKMKLENHMASIKENQTLSDATESLEKELKKMSARSVQRLLREIDLVVLSTGLVGFSREVQTKIFEGLSKMAQSNVLDFIELQEKIGSAQMVDAQSIIANTIKALRVEGEIM